MGDELRNFRYAHFFGVAFDIRRAQSGVMEKDIRPDPQNVGLFCAVAFCCRFRGGDI